MVILAKIGQRDDSKFAHSVKSPPRIVLQKISYELNKSIKNEYDGDTDASVRQKFETRKTQWCYACTATFSGDELIQNTDCMEISEQSLALPILDYNCATKMDRQRVLYRNNWYDVWSLERGRSSYFYSQEEIISRYSNYDLIATGETAFDRRQVPCADNYCNNISGWEIINAFPNTKLLAENFTSLEYDNKRSKSPPESCFVCQEVLVSDGNVLESLEGEENCVLLTQNSTVEPIITEHKECGVTESWGYARKLDGTVATLSSAERRIVSWGDPSPFNCLPGWSYCYAYCQEGDKCNGRFI
ncbi:unnamed protein product [Oikopleura dioica]|uniref:Uncharacterized protein n=1 Tax=Oikopleura dioica TaxID=34765 RepID=E4XFN8_OIKDI|nr:unnamed protein product [Oikopleura dioica]